MNQKKIIDIHDGERLSQVFLCRIKKEAVSKTGKSYYALTLTDATGNLEGKVWDINQAIEDFDAGDFIVCDGNVNTFNNVLQLNINRLRLAQKNEYRAEDFFPFLRDGLDWLMPFYEYFLTLPELEEYVEIGP